MHMFGKKEPLNEERKVDIINDLYSQEYLEDLDISYFFVPKKLSSYAKLFKSSTADICTHKKEYIFLSLYPKIKILKLKRVANQDIKKVKKNKPLILREKLSIKKDFLDLRDEEKILQKTKIVFDMHHPEKKLTQFFFHRNIFIGAGVFVFLLFFVGFYGLFVKNNIESTFSYIAQTNLSDIQDFKQNFPIISTKVQTSYYLSTPIFFVNFFLQNQTLSNLEYILKSTYLGVNIVNKSLLILDGVEKNISKKGVENVLFSQLLYNIRPGLEEIKKDGEKILFNISSLSSLEDDSLNAFVQKAEDKLSFYSEKYVSFMENFDLILEILGHDKKQTYMILLQNNDEIRPTGGFLGSVILVDIFRGKIENFENKDIYALEWELKDFATKSGVAFEELSPPGIDKISPTFGLRDANYYPNFGESTRKIESFLQKSNRHIDGIIYLNQNIIGDLLTLTGPIYFEDIEREIDAQNFGVIFSTLVEAKITKTDTLSTPKQILFDFIEVFKKELLSQDRGEIIKIIFKNFSSRDLYVSFLDEERNEIFQTIGIQQDIIYSDYFDFNYPIFTSYSGNKSDRYMERIFEKNIEIGPNCELKSDFSIIQKHNFSLRDEIYIKTLLYDMDALGHHDLQTLLDIEGRGVNRQYIRVLLPPNAQVQEKNDQEVTYFPDHIEVSFFAHTNSIYENKKTISYTLPNPDCQEINYLMQKQPGIAKYQLDLKKDGNSIYLGESMKDFIYNF